ncbi:MAG: hypothetical protein ACK5RT_02115 [Dolichospermum sp.]|jgi:hypothetical protein
MEVETILVNRYEISQQLAKVSLNYKTDQGYAIMMEHLSPGKGGRNSFSGIF